VSLDSRLVCLFKIHLCVCTTRARPQTISECGIGSLKLVRGCGLREKRPTNDSKRDERITLICVNAQPEPDPEKLRDEIVRCRVSRIQGLGFRTQKITDDYDRDRQILLKRPTNDYKRDLQMTTKETSE